MNNGHNELGQSEAEASQCAAPEQKGVRGASRPNVTQPQAF